ncbi:protein NLP5-like [Malania oleifera]|uniref:protein NLP5-like n=1 Tax=Malania oleifera TaxID=397392 RepID=UPI0025AE82AF|nr:protein NLP5-like [Malania oleifera]
MDDAICSSRTILGGPPDSTLDFDYMDELLLDGCWLRTTENSEFLHQSPSISSSLFDPSNLWPSLEPNNDEPSRGPSQKDTQEVEKMSFSLNFHESRGEDSVETQSLSISRSSKQSQNYFIEGSELEGRWGVGPQSNPGPASSVIEKLISALGYIKASKRDRDVLIQIWVPVNIGGRRVLTTYDQPFSLDPSSMRLAGYRNISVRYQFAAEKNSNEFMGLPGRVFLGKVPEWTPDVRFFKRDEYPRVDFAQQYNVSGSLALPVFEQSSQTCLGVIEVVMTTQKMNYHPELESICKALQAVDLRSSEVYNTRNSEGCSGSYQVTIPEILEVLRSACIAHRLPLAQTWVPCIRQGKGGCRHSDENFVNCVSTVDSACYVVDPLVQGFHEACSEHHLFRGQGIVGEAFLMNQPCFSPDVTSIRKTEYPLSHHARMFGLRAAVAIRLRSIETGSDFVLEFFLPADCKDLEEQKKMLRSLSIIIQQVCQSLRVLSNKELEEETILPVREVIVPLGGRPIREKILKVGHTNLERSSRKDSAQIAFCMQAQQGCDVVPLFQMGKPIEVLNEKSSEFWQLQQDPGPKGSAECRGECSTFSEGSFSKLGKAGEKRQTKAEKKITLQVLQQYFAGSLRDAAKSLGVCSTTLKKICRQHGIKRWPSRKLKKVGHSLKKLQHVIDSVHGPPGGFQIGSFYSNFPELASSNLSRTSPFKTPKLNDHLKPSTRPPDDGVCSPQTTTSISTSSSCSQSSSSSHCCFSGAHHPSNWNIPGSDDITVAANSSDDVLKRVRNDSEPYSSNQELAKNSGRVSPEGEFWRVKITYGEEKVQFQLQNSWGFNDLLQEIGRRFSTDDMSRFHLKYLDDDSEWVLLTCDADLEECIDVCRSLSSHTIKISLLQVSHHHPTPLGSSCPP